MSENICSINNVNRVNRQQQTLSNGHSKGISIGYFFHIIHFCFTFAQYRTLHNNIIKLTFYEQII